MSVVNQTGACGNLSLVRLGKLRCSLPRSKMKSGATDKNFESTWPTRAPIYQRLTGLSSIAAELVVEVSGSMYFIS